MHDKKPHKRITNDRDNKAVSQAQLGDVFSENIATLIFVADSFRSEPQNRKNLLATAFMMAVITCDAIYYEVTKRIGLRLGCDPGELEYFACAVDRVREYSGGAAISKSEAEDIKLLHRMRNGFAHKVAPKEQFDFIFSNNRQSELSLFVKDVARSFDRMLAYLGKVEREPDLIRGRGVVSPHYGGRLVIPH